MFTGLEICTQIIYVENSDFLLYVGRFCFSPISCKSGKAEGCLTNKRVDLLLE